LSWALALPGRLTAHFYFFLISSSSSASLRKRRSSSLSLAYLSIHSTALSYHLRASSLAPCFQWAMARKNQSKASPPLRSSIDLFKPSIAAFQFPVRYWAAPSVFHELPAFGASSTAFRANSTARFGSRNFGSGQVASSQARLFQAEAFLGSNSIALE